MKRKNLENPTIPSAVDMLCDFLPVFQSMERMMLFFLKGKMPKAEQIILIIQGWEFIAWII